MAGVALSCGSGNRLGQFINSTSNSDKLALTLNPNPANKELNISLGSGYSGAADVEVFDLSGKSQLFKTVDYNHTALPLDISSLSGGIYMVRVTAGETVLTQRLVKSTYR